MRILKLARVLALCFGVMVCSNANAKTTYIYEGMENTNFHVHVTYHDRGGIRVGWFKLKPQVKQIGSWSCGRYGNELKCKEPNGITQHIYLSSDGNYLRGLAQRFKLIKKVNK